MSTNNLNPKIYIACIAAYNNGYLHGRWVDANQDIDSLYAELKDMLATSPISDAEEWAIHAYEDFGDIELSESTSLETVVSLVAFIVEHGKLGTAVFSHCGGRDIDKAREVIEEHYHGEYESEEDFACCHFETCYEIPDYLAFYIDYKAIARDLFINDYFSIEINFKVHVFSHY